MPCAFNKTYDGLTACPPPSPGLDETKLWIINRADITWTGGTNKLYTDITLAGATLAYRWKVHNKGFNYTDQFTESDATGAKSYSPRVNFRLLGFDAATSAAVEAFYGVDVVAIFQTKEGKFIVAGSESGLRLKVNTTGSDADTLGETVALGSDEEPSKHYQLLDTDEATTLALLVALES